MSITSLIIDMDGVLWRGNTPLPGLSRFFELLDRGSFGYVLATNNATKTAAAVARRLLGFGVTVPEDRILTSAEAAAIYLRERLPAGSAVFAVGAPGLHDALAAQGFDVLMAAGDERLEESAAVVVGLAPDACYEQLAAAARLVGRGVPFVGTNPDVTLPTEAGPMPGAGALLAFVQAASGVAAVIIGKPEPPLLREALRRLTARPENTLMVGDRLETDIVGAAALDIHTALMLTGVTRPEDLQGGTVRPDMIFAGLDELSDFLESQLIGGDN